MIPQRALIAASALIGFSQFWLTASMAQAPGNYYQQNGYGAGQDYGAAYPGQGSAPQNGYYAPQAQMPPGGYGQPMGQPYAGGQYSGEPPVAGGKGQAINLGQWFQQFNEIRHRAQMSPTEKQQADKLMSNGLSVLIPGDQKAAAKQILISLGERYKRACAELKALPVIPQTQNLHYGYFQYFATAAGLFDDYVRVQNNVFVKDASTGSPIAAGLLQRKQMLQGLEYQVKALDGQLRQQLNIRPYPY